VNLLASNKRAKQRWATRESVLHQRFTPITDATPLFIEFLFPAYMASGILCVVFALAQLIVRWSLSASPWSLGWRPKSFSGTLLSAHSSPKSLLCLSADGPSPFSKWLLTLLTPLDVCGSSLSYKETPTFTCDFMNKVNPFITVLLLFLHQPVWEQILYVYIYYKEAAG